MKKENLKKYHKTGITGVRLSKVTKFEDFPKSYKETGLLNMLVKT